MPSVADRVRETTTTTGTGTVNLEGAVTGFQLFSAAFSTGTVVYYCISDGTNWEIGYGAVTTGSPWTLARSTVLQSSNADALVNFGAGIKDVFCTMPAQALDVHAATSKATPVVRIVVRSIICSPPKSFAYYSTTTQKGTADCGSLIGTIDCAILSVVFQNTMTGKRGKK